MKNYLKPIRNTFNKIKQSNQVRKINDYLTDLKLNTNLAEKKYEELQEIKKDISQFLLLIENETFETEIVTINNFEKTDKKTRNNMIKELTTVKNNAIKELIPLINITEKLEGHFIITLNKIQIYGGILRSKQKLVYHSKLQVDSLELIKKESKFLSEELEKLIKELDEINNICSNNITEVIKNISGGHIIQNIKSKYQLAK